MSITELALVHSLISSFMIWTSSHKKTIVNMIISNVEKHLIYAAMAFLQSVIIKALGVQQCHIIIAISDWITNIGLKMISHMCNYYRHNRYNWLLQKDPAFMQFIHYCILYLKTAQSPKTKWKEELQLDSKIIEKFKQMFSSGDIQKLPKDLYGLILTARGIIIFPALVPALEKPMTLCTFVQ